MYMLWKRKKKYEGTEMNHYNVHMIIQPYRVGNADEITASAPAMMHNYQQQNQLFNFRGKLTE